MAQWYVTTQRLAAFFAVLVAAGSLAWAQDNRPAQMSDGQLNDAEILAIVDSIPLRLSSGEGDQGEESPFRFVQDADQPIESRPFEDPTASIFSDLAISPVFDSIDFGQSSSTSGKAPDITAQIAEAAGGQTVKAQRRSPVAFDPRIRGYRWGQIYAQADGALWRPAREDLDSMLSKIAPHSVAGARVINGPYGVRYGPGFAFLDLQTADTPRYDDGPERHTSIGSSFRANGDQWYNYATAEGGSVDWGYRISYGNRTGVDYLSGNGTAIPSGYQNQDFVAQFGFDLNPFQTLEFRYQRLDQTNAEYFGKFFDTRFLVTDGFNLRLVDESPDGPWSRLTLEGWFNRTRYEGDTDTTTGKTSTMARVERALERSLTVGIGTVNFRGDTYGDQMSTGARSAMTFGDLEESYMTLGADYRYLEQRTSERFFTTVSGAPATAPLDDFSTNQPRSWMTDPGAFVEASTPLSSYWTVTTGGRVDWIHTNANRGDIRANTSLPGAAGGADLSRNDVLYSFFLNNQIELDQNWTIDVGFGHGQRPPTLTERYADGVFLAIFQNGFSRVIGNSFLKPERAWQIDAGISAEYGCFRGSMRGFQSWIIDYNNYEVVTVSDPLGAQLVRGKTTDLATLTGFELEGVADLDAAWSVFANLSYVDGRDRDLDVPLTGISPLEARIGLRLHDPHESNRWGVEFYGRLVDTQNRLAALPNASGVGATTVESLTPSFAVWHLRAFYNATSNLKLNIGIENVFDRNYLESLDLRLPADNGGTGTTVDDIAALSLFSPGFTPYFGLEWSY